MARFRCFVCEGRPASKGFHTCAVCRADLTRRMIDQRWADFIAEGKPKPPPTKRKKTAPIREPFSCPCFECGASFETFRANQKYCSTQCSGAAHRRTYRERQKALGHTAAGEPLRKPELRTCGHCGDEYMAKYKRNRWCSPACRYAAGAARTKAAGSRQARRAVRNGLQEVAYAYTCSGCGGVVILPFDHAPKWVDIWQKLQEERWAVFGSELLCPGCRKDGYDGRLATKAAAIVTLRG